MTLQTSGVMPPDETSMLKDFKIEMFQSLNCVKIGQVESFDPDAKTAVVQILGQRVLADGVTTVSYPPIPDCPVFTLQGGGAFIQMPIAAGDQCLVLFSDRNIDAWFSSGSAQPPDDPRLHSFSDGICLVGLNALTSSMPDYLTDRINITFGTAKLQIKNDNTFVIKNGVTDLLTVLNNLVSTLESATIDTVHGVFSSTTITALGVVATELATLLESA
jgi:hypothetical protein